MSVEVVKRYQQGERDFRRVNLRGQSFKGQDLSGADFSECDIRGTNFKGTILRGVKFRGAQAGLQKRWAIAIILISWLISAISGFLFGFIGYLVTLIFENSLESQFAGWASLIGLIIFYIVTIRQGLGAGLGVIAIAIAIVLACAVAYAVARAFAVAFAVALTGAFAGAVAIAVVIAVGLAVSLAVVFAGVIAVVIAVVLAIAVAIAVVIAGVVALGEAFSGFLNSVNLGLLPFFLILAGGIAVAIAGTAVSAYLGRRAIRGDPRDAWIRTLALVFASMVGTSFYDADLIDADFTGATLKSTDLRAKNFTRACWRDAITLERARLGTSYLQDKKVRHLLITGEGQGQNFDRLDLRGINLKGANLQDASFIGTELNRANLQDVNLSRAKLVQTLLEGADLTRATLTGAYIEDWGISNTTKLIQIDCDYIYLKLPTNLAPDPQRRPADLERNFEPGEFAKLAQKIPNTVDLVFKDGIDWQSFLKTFQELRVESDTGELPVIQTIENKGEGAFVIRVKVPDKVDEAEYERKFWLKYKPMLETKDKEIKLLSQQTEFYSQQIEIIRKDNTKLIGIVETMAEKETTKYDLRGAKFGGGFGGEKQEGGTFYDYSSNPSNTNLAEAAAEIQQLLQQLSQTYPTSTNKEKMAVVAEAVDQIESNPTLKARVINALKAGGTETLKEAIDHPLVNILMATIEGWQEAE